MKYSIFLQSEDLDCADSIKINSIELLTFGSQKMYSNSFKVHIEEIITITDPKKNHRFKDNSGGQILKNLNGVIYFAW